MYSAVFTGEKQLKIIQKDKPVPSFGEVLIKIDTACICGTDVHILHGEFDAVPPVVLGHEFSGYVDEIGEGVIACSKGDLVTVEPHIFCGVCKYCRIGKIQECLNKKAFGVHLDGGFQQYVVVPQETVYRVPEGITAEQAALVEPIGCCLHGVQQVGVDAGDTVLILGGGVIGLILAKIAKTHGAANIIVSEPIKERREMMLENGVDDAVDPINEDIEQRILELTGGLLADVVIEAAGRPETAERAIRLAGRCGKILFFGVVPPQYNIKVNPNTVFKKELKIVGSAINPFVHYRVIAMLSKLDVSGLITHRFPLSAANEAMDAAKRSVGLKICIKPNMN